MPQANPKQTSETLFPDGPRAMSVDRANPHNGFVPLTVIQFPEIIQTFASGNFKWTAGFTRFKLLLLSTFIWLWKCQRSELVLLFRLSWTSLLSIT